MKKVHSLLLVVFTIALLASCNNSEADKMFGTWSGSTSNSKGERFITLTITENNRFELLDSCVFNNDGNPTIANSYVGQILTDGAFSIYKSHPWADPAPAHILLESITGYSRYLLSGEAVAARASVKNDPNTAPLRIYSRGSKGEDPNINGWFVNLEWYDIAYFKTIGFKGTTKSLDDFKLVKQTQRGARSVPIENSSGIDEEVIGLSSPEEVEIAFHSDGADITDNGLNPEGLINVSNLNFRSSPEIADNIMGLLDKGDRVFILKKLSIDLDNRVKGILSNSIRIYVEGKEVKIHKGRALIILKQLRDKIICEVDLGKKELTEIVVSRKNVEIIHEESWIKIQRNDTIGYVYARFVDE